MALIGDHVPRREGVAPAHKATCLQRTGGELNADFVQYRSGRREPVRTNYDGTRTVGAV